MNKRLMMEKAAMSLEAEIKMAYLETHGWTLEECGWKDFLRENRDDFLEYREWHLTCYA